MKIRRLDSMRVAVAAAALLAAAFAPNASAYVGPGAGLGVIGAILAVLAAIAVTLFGLVLLPWRMLKRRRKAKADASKSGDVAK